MFRDVAYVTPDYTIRVQDGFLVFRWWRSYVPKDVSEDLSHSDTRLSVQVWKGPLINAHLIPGSLFRYGRGQSFMLLLMLTLEFW